MVGKIATVLDCAHVDVKRGTIGLIKDTYSKNGKVIGYAVEVTCQFAADIHGIQMRTKTETVFVRTADLRIEV